MAACKISSSSSRLFIYYPDAHKGTTRGCADATAQTDAPCGSFRAAVARSKRSSSCPTGPLPSSSLHAPAACAPSTVVLATRRLGGKRARATCKAWRTGGGRVGGFQALRPRACRQDLSAMAAKRARARDKKSRLLIVGRGRGVRRARGRAGRRLFVVDSVRVAYPWKSTERQGAVQAEEAALSASGLTPHARVCV